MKYILASIILLALVSPILAMPTDMMNNSDVCKIGFDTGSSMIGIFAWHNLQTHQWEVVLGSVTYKGTSLVPGIFKGDDTSIVAVDLT
jgi:hypothetical protein